MSESAQSTVGQVLRDARETQGISQDDAAARLRLMHRQIEAMEADDFQSLGQPVFARGFVRNYARLLGLEPEALLDRMEGAPAESATVTHVEPPPPRSALASPWLILLLVGVLLVVAVPVGLYLWLNSGAEEVPVAAQTTVAQSRSRPVAPPTPVVVEPTVETPAEPADATAAADAETVTPTEPTAVTGLIRLEFGAEAWTEIKDASGRTLHRKLDPPGSSIEVRGQPPFEVVIGNAAQASMTYNGRPIDLKPFIDVTVARFTLEE